MVQSPSWEANWFAACQEIPRISRNPKVHYRTHKRPPPVSFLDQPNPVHIPTSHLLEIHPNIIHPSTSRSPQWSPSFWFPQQDPIRFSYNKFLYSRRTLWNALYYKQCSLLYVSATDCGHLQVDILWSIWYIECQNSLICSYKILTFRQKFITCVTIWNINKKVCVELGVGKVCAWWHRPSGSVPHRNQQTRHHRSDLRLDSDSNRNENQGSILGCIGGRCVGLKTLSHSCANFL